jgi:hypothetical protein
MRRRSLVSSTLCALALSFRLPVAAQVNVLTYHNDNMRTGANLQETALTPANVNSSSFGKLFSYGLDGDVYAQPLYMSGLNIAGRGTHNVVFVATEHNSVYALDADDNSGSTGGVLWQVNLGPSAATPNNDFGTRYGAFAILPEVGITGTPVIDQGSGILFVDAFTHEGGTYYHKIHALDINSGAERPFSPVIVAATIPGTGAGSSTNGVLSFEARQHLQRAALTLANGVVYVAYAGYGDTDPFHGWLIGFNAANLQPLPNFIFNSTPNSMTRDFGPNAGEGGIWMGGCGLAVDGAGYLYLATGNGSFNANNATNGTEYGSSFVKLSTAGGLSVADYFTPYNQKYLSENDLDLGSGGVVLLPDQAGPYPHLLVGAGKPGTAYVLNRDQFTAGNNHYNATGTVDFVAQKLTLSGGVMTTPAYFNGTLYYAASKDVLSAFTLTNGMFPNRVTATGSRVFNYPGVTPSVSANGNQNGIVWAIQRANPAVLVAYDAANITEEIYDSSKAGTRDRLGAAIKFAVPTIANGKVYVGGQSALAVFGLLPQSSTNSNNSTFAGNYNGLFFEADSVQLLTSGSFALTVTKRGTYTGRLQMGSNRYPFKGQLDSDGSSVTPISRNGANAVTLTFQIDPDDSGRITGSMSDGNWTADLIADRAVFNARTNPAPFAGRYTVIFPGSTNHHSPLPQGNGFATITVSRAGVVACSASLADGTKVTQSATIGQRGHWPFYAGLYRGRGQLLGWLNFTNAGQAAVIGQTSWIKTEASGGIYYADGFDFPVSAAGSSYQPPSRGLPILDISDGYVSFRNGGLGASITNEVTISANNKVTNLSDNKLVLTVTPASGLFRGTVANPDGGKPIPFSGVVLQNQNAGSGYFLLWNQSGRVDLGGQ